jgi:hypothetical protein
MGRRGAKQGRGRGAKQGRGAAALLDPWKALAVVVGVGAVLFMLAALGPAADRGSQLAMMAAGGLRCHGDYTPMDESASDTPAGQRAARDMALALQLIEDGDPKRLAARKARRQAEEHVALFIEGCRVDGLSFCGTYRELQGRSGPGGFPRYRNKNGKELYRSTARHFWLLADSFTPDTPPGPGEASIPVTFKTHSAVPSTAVPLGSHPWWWTAPPGKGGGAGGGVGFVGAGGSELQLEEQTLTVSALVNEEEVVCFEAYAEEQLEFELEAGDSDAGLVSSGAHKALEDYDHVDLGGPMAAALEVPKDGMGCDLIRLTFPSGAAMEFNTGVLRPGQFLMLEMPLSPEDVTEVRNKTHLVFLLFLNLASL